MPTRSSAGAPRASLRRRYGLDPLERRVLLHGLHHDTHPAPDLGNELTPMPEPTVGVIVPSGDADGSLTPAAIADQKLPDVFPLISDPDDYVYGWQIDQNEIPGRTLLRLTTAIANGGHGAMELRGSTINSDGTQNVLQRIYLEGGGFIDRLAGTFSYHPGHGHIHFDGFAAYHLRQVTPGNGVGAIVASGDKVSFCLLDIDRYNSSLPGSPANAAYVSCGQVQGISVGWADVYDMSLDDQWIDVTDMEDGQYWLEVVADPDNRLLELNESNNVDRILINLDLPTRDPVVVAQQPTGQSLVPVSSVDVTFSEAMDPASFSVAADITSFTGPGATNLLGQITGYSWLDGNRRLRITFSTQSVHGAYAMVIGPQVLSLDNGHPMDQDADELPGEAVADRYTVNFEIQDHLGPDGFGYRAYPIPFQPVDLAPGGPGVFNILTNSDDASATINLLQPFNFYGTTYSGTNQVFISSNGLITFGAGNTTLDNGDLTSNPSQRSIAPLWDDWRTDQNTLDSVIGKYDGDANADGIFDRLIIEWNQVQHFSTSPSTVTFQAILQLSTGLVPGDIIFNYPDLNSGDLNTNGGSATVGIKDAGTQGSRRLLLSHNNGNGLIASGSAIRVAIDHVAPTADIVDVAPDPRGGPVNSIVIAFSERVTGFGLPDLNLRRDGGPNLLPGDATLATSDGGLTWTLGNLSSATGPAGVYQLTLATAGSGIVDVAGNALARDAVESWTRVALPAVTDVFVNGTSWAAAFKNYLGTSGLGEAAFGYRTPAASQTNELPWTNVNQVSVRFSEHVTVSADGLVVRGVTVPTYTGLTMTYDAATFTATWMFPSALTADKLLLDLNAESVSDSDGNALDGEWTNPFAPAEGGADLFPSGDAGFGGDFQFRLNVLPGDVNGTNSILGTDVTLVRNAQGSSPGFGLYTIFKDVNGSGSILGTDVTLVRNRQGTRLPTAEPVAPTAETAVATSTNKRSSLFTTSAKSRSAMQLLAQQYDLLGDPLEMALLA